MQETTEQLSLHAKRRMEARFFLIYAALFTPYAVVTPYLQQLLHLYGFQHDQIGFIQGAVELMAFLAPPLWGIFSDRVRCPRLVLICSILLSIPALLLLGPGQSTVVAFSIALLFGFFNKPSIPLTDGLTFSHFRRNGCDYGHVRIGGTVGFVLSTIIFESVLHISHDKTGSLILAVLCFALLFQASCVMAVPKIKEKNEKKADNVKGEAIPWRILVKPTFMAVIFAAFLARFAMMSYYSFFSRYLNEVYDFQSVGYIWILGSMSEFPIVFWSKSIMAKIGVKNLFVLAMVGTVCRLLGFAFDTNIYIVSAMQVFHALTFGAYHCSTVTYVSKAFPAKYQGSAQALYSACTVGLGGLLGSSFSGIILRHYGYTAMYIAASATAFVALLISLPLKMDEKTEMPARQK